MGQVVKASKVKVRLHFLLTYVPDGQSAIQMI